MAARVALAREIQRERYHRLGQPNISCNAAASAALVEQVIQMDDAGRNLVRDASDRLRLSARGFHRISNWLAQLRICRPRQMSCGRIWLKLYPTVPPPTAITGQLKATKRSAIGIRIE